MLALNRTYVRIWRPLVSDQSDHERRLGKSHSEPPSEPLILDPAAVANAAGLVHEVALLRAAIRCLAGPGNVGPHVRTLAELRHQIEALCTALKTQQALAGRDDDLSGDLARALEELGDELGVPR